MDDGTIGWVTVMVQDNNSTWTSDVALADAWESAYPSSAPAVVVEDPQALYSATAPMGFFPTVHTIDAEFNWLILDDGVTWNNLVDIATNPTP